jgi:tetratricopeptide (TPR) repeat protein
LSPEFLQTISRLDVEIAAEPKDPNLLANRAWHLNEIGQPQLALADAKSALAAEPKSADASAEAGYALAKLQRKAEAYGQIERATELDPTLATAWQYRGELEMERDDYKAAIDSLTHALSINQTAAALTKREECYRKVSLLEKAEDDHKALEQFGPQRSKTP